VIVNPLRPTIEDRTTETDFRLGEFASQLQLVSDYEADNKRAAAVAVLNAIGDGLPEDYIAEQQYILLRTAALWAFEGDGQDLSKSEELLDGFTPHNHRVAAEYDLLRFQMADPKSDEALRYQINCFSNFGSVDAFKALVRAGRVMADRYMQHGLEKRAKDVLSSVLIDSSRLEPYPQHLYVCLDMGAVSREDVWFNQAYITALKLEGEGWKTIVVATATDYWFNAGDMEKAASWGARIRTAELGEIPNASEAGLWPEDHALLLAQYALALHQTDLNSHRLEESLKSAKAAMEGLPEVAAEWAKPWLEKLAAALLQAVGD
jgi:hypothetical protein